MSFIKIPEKDWRGNLKIKPGDWTDLIKSLRSDMDKIVKELKDRGYMDSFRLSQGVNYIDLSARPAADVRKMEEKLDLLIDHLELEYNPERKCGPTLEPKQKEEDNGN